MAAPRAKRRLAAILATDVVGYSRLMGRDETGTLERLKAYRKELVEPLIDAHQGRVVKLMGDGALVEFGSVVDAVECAVAIQTGMAERERNTPEHERIRLRIGINLGDVIHEDSDLYGDGVNVAARLEQIAEPGGIVVSGTAYDHLQGKLACAFQYLGERRLKNIERAARVYRVASDSTTPTSVLALPLPDKPSVVVLPFENMSGDPEQGYFSDGVTDDLITDLSKISGLFVIARNSAFTYKSKAVKVQEVSRELGVRYVLEGSVRKAGNRVRITAQLIDGLTGGHLWAERYDRDLTDIFAVQDEVTREIVSALAVKLTKQEKERLSRKGTDNLEAYDHFLRGREHAWRHTGEGSALARPLLERAIALDPGFPAAYAMLAHILHLEYVNRWSDTPEQSLRQAHKLALKAVALDDSEPQAHFALGVVSMWMKELERALAEGEKVLALDPNFAPGYALLGNTLNYAGRPEEAIEQLTEAMRLDPHYPDVYLYFLGMARFLLGRYEAAIDVLRERIARNPDTDVTHVLLAACCGHLGRIEEARAEWREALRINPDFSLEHRRQILPFKNPGDFERIADGLREVGPPGFGTATQGDKP
ncbi:adenylate/guanylate cyclase domain-containing protein [Rhodospirillaceae bacterium SYSU D60014]|uniref:adenylate/guanylate cyclase domain-containing protein n=1 Tax=Virgifigura deserti TaxID=2268457 RepID=UPI000E669748